VSPAVWQVYQI